MNQLGRTKDMEENIVWDSKMAKLILIHLYKIEVDYASNTAREIKFWMGGVINKFKELKDEGLIEPTEKKERRTYPKKYPSKKNKYYKLTVKGKKVVELLLKIDRELK